MPSRFTLGRKMFVLLAIPLSSTLAILWTFNLLIESAEADAVRQRRAKETVAAAAAVEHSVYGLIGSFVLFAATKNPVLEQRFEQRFERLPNEISQLGLRADTVPVMQEKMRRIRFFSQRLLDMLRVARDGVDQSGTLNVYTQTAEFNSQVEPLLHRLSLDLKDIDDIGQRMSQSTSDSQNRFRQLIRQFIGVAGILSVGLVAALGLLAYKGTIARLSVLMDNTHRFSRRQKLNPPVKGEDEIAGLDQTFHNMVATLAQVEQLKQDCMDMIGHDLRAPLMSIQGKLFLVSSAPQNFCAEPQKLVALATRAEHECERLIGLVNQLLDVDKLASGDLELNRVWTEVSELFDRSCNAVSGLAEQRNLSIVLPETDLEAYVDGDRIIQVVVNLLSNAIKFSPPDSSIILSVSENIDWTEIAVSDIGPGVAPEEQGQIFERFKQGKRNPSQRTTTGGVGFGLYGCKLIVEAHGGTIGVESAEGRGSRFWFRIPANPDTRTQPSTIDDPVHPIH